MATNMQKKYDVLLVGGGLVGLTAAFALSQAGLHVSLCVPHSQAEDPRTTALLDGSVSYLDSLGLWTDIKTKAHPLKTMRLVDGSDRLLRFQQTEFHSSEIGLEAFGYNVRNSDLVKLLWRRLKQEPAVSVIDGVLSKLEHSKNGSIDAYIIHSDGTEETYNTPFVLGADGKSSKVREFFGSGVRDWSYPQSAIVVDFEHQFHAAYTSTEFHTNTGPFTIVPQSKNRAGLVWLEAPKRAGEITKMDKSSINNLIETMMHSYLGKIEIVSRPKSFPISGMMANVIGNASHALVGEAAHVFPPIGAQGFNLGIRDVQEFTNFVNNHWGSREVGTLYNDTRIRDIRSTTIGVDLLNRSLLSDFLPIQFARATGMYALGTFSPLRKEAMKLGISPFGQK